MHVPPSFRSLPHSQLYIAIQGYKGTTQDSISGPYLFNLFLNDLEIVEHEEISLFKYADDSTILVTISRDLPDVSGIALIKFMDWTHANSVHCNTSKCNSLFHKKGNPTAYPMLYSIIRSPLERFSNECRKTKTKAITPANHNKHKLSDEPIRTRSKYMLPASSAGKSVRARASRD